MPPDANTILSEPRSVKKAISYQYDWLSHKIQTKVKFRIGWMENAK